MLISARNPSALVLRQLTLELDALDGEFEETLPAVALAGALLNEALAHELAEDARQALLGDLQNVEQFADAHLRMAPDEIDHAVMRAAETIAHEHRIGLGGEVAIGIEQELDALPDFVLAEIDRRVLGLYVRHVDLFLAGLLHFRQAASQPCGARETQSS